MKKYKNVVWDWNGTLLNDVNTGVNTLNRMLEKRGLPTLSLATYRNVFGFPVEDFYRKVGFNLQQESLHEISVDFVETYDLCAREICLNPGVTDTLRQIQHLGIKQYILSALREDLLKQMVTDFHIQDFFYQVCGSDNIYASGKVERGKQMVDKYHLCPAETLMIGDTIHDAEVAKALGFDVLLYTGGHNSSGRLAETAKIISQMDQIPEMIYSH